jgi:hypothetical protein
MLQGEDMKKKPNLQIKYTSPGGDSIIIQSNTVI